LDPSKRPTLEQILDHDFFRIYTSVPHVLPISTLACPPSEYYLTQFVRKDNFGLGLMTISHHGMTNSISNLNFEVKKNLNTIKTNSTNHKKSNSFLEFNSSNNIVKVKNKKIIDEEGLNQSLDDNEKENLNNNINNFLLELENENNVQPNLLYSQSLSKIVNYFDFTSKFGIVYIISSEFNFIGISFNDFSTLILNLSLIMVDNKNKLCYNYFDKEHKNILNFDESGFDLYLKQKTISKELTKKFEIFKQIHLKYRNEISNLKPLYGNIDSASYSISKVIFIKDFIKVQQAIMFRLSNKLIQICFPDQTEILMSTESVDFIFKNKNGEEFCDSIYNGICSDNNDIVRRIKFSKSLMIYFVRTYKSGIKRK
jgi:polo-like kinase 1